MQRRTAVLLHLVIATVFAAVVLGAPGPGTIAGAAFATTTEPEVPPDLGYDAGDTGNSGRNVTGEKPQSKVWQHDGSWWAVMRAPERFRYEIFRLDAGVWTSTGALVSWRGDTRADVLPVDGALYLATHHVSSSNASTGTLPSEFRAYDYDPATRVYVARPGFPSRINAMGRCCPSAGPRPSSNRWRGCWPTGARRSPSVSRPPSGHGPGRSCATWVPSSSGSMPTWGRRAPRRSRGGRVPDWRGE